MEPSKTVLITGAAGNLGGKLRRHLEGRFHLRLLDRVASASDGIGGADFSQWDQNWADQFHGVDVVVHLAADPAPHRDWAVLLGPNLDGTAHVLEACARGGVARVVYASSNHVMGGYCTVPEPALLTTDLPPRPGVRFGLGSDSTAYGAAKLFGERLGRCFAEVQRRSFIAVRIGWVQPGANEPPSPASPATLRQWAKRLLGALRSHSLPSNLDSWFRLMWLSNRDYCQLMERCILAEAVPGFLVVNGMSANTGMRWDIDPARRMLGYAPQDDVARGK